METTIIFISSKKNLKKIKKYIDQSLIFSYIIYVIDSEGKKKEKRCWHGVTGSHTRFRFLYRKM